MARDLRKRADLIEAISVGYGGSRSEDGSRQMQRLVSELREGPSAVAPPGAKHP